MPKWYTPERFSKRVTPGSRIVERIRCSCRKKIKNIDALRFHLATSAAHADDRGHQCSTCHAAFEKFEDLAAHLITEGTHMRIRSKYYKPEHETLPPAPSLDATAYRVVAMIDTPANRYYCRRCYQSFSNLEELVHHLEHGKRHQTNRTECQTCATAFGDRLEAHLVWSGHMRLPPQGTPFITRRAADKVDHQQSATSRAVSWIRERCRLIWRRGLS